MYIGRFAPTPSGPLHFGSIITALASYLDAKNNKGIWKIRIDDIDSPRVVKGAESAILSILENLGLFWDDEIFRQSKNVKSYENYFEILCKKNLTYNCQCSRKQIASLNKSDSNEIIYNNYCREKQHPASNSSSVRIIANFTSTNFLDRAQGFQAHKSDSLTGDFIIKRSDQIYAYQLTAVIDDELQSVTDIVRGSDLLNSTIKQHYINTLLNFPEKNFMHIPVASINNRKLSKGNGDKINTKNWSLVLIEGLKFLKQKIQKDMEDAKPEEILKYASKNWDIKPLQNLNSIELDSNQRSFVDNIHT